MTALLETPEQREFRRAVRSVLADPATHAAVERDECDVDPRPAYRRLGERGWLAPSWPERYGGLGAGAVESAIVAEEVAFSGIPDTGFVNSVRNAGAFLLAAGSDDQRDRHLRPIAAGDLLVAILYTEPESGSDLASLRTRAERVDGGWRLHGRKTYNVNTRFADYGLCIARTAEGRTKYSGLSLFMVPLARPEVHVEPLDAIGPDRFYSVDLDGVEIGDEDVVGEVGRGWSLVNAALAMERTGLDFNAKVRRWWQRLRDAASARGLLADPVVADELVRLRALLDAGRALSWRLVRHLVDGEVEAGEAAMGKWFNAELARELVAAAARLGCVGLSTDDALAVACREAPGLTLAAGTENVMLYLIASELEL